MTWLYVPLTLLAALGFAAAAVLQQLEAARQPAAASGLLLQLLRRPLWLLGMLAYVVAYGLQVWAVSLGPVVVIQPLIAAQLVFSLVLSTLFLGRHTGAREWLGAGAVTLGLAGFIVGTDPRPGDPAGAPLGWAVGVGGVALLTALSIVWAGRSRGAARSAAFGVAAGLAWGLMIVLMKTVTHALSLGGEGAAVALLAHPALWALLVSAIGGFVLLQQAFQAGSLTHALVAYTLVEIVVAVVLGIALFGERPHTGTLSLVLTASAAALMTAGIVSLAGAVPAETDAKPA